MKGHKSSPPLWHEVTAAFGGRFDPPHLGHREAVRGLFKTPGVKRVLILPSASPAYKATWASPEHRSEMARIAFETKVQDPFPTAEVHLDYRELERAKQKPNHPTYTFDSLQELRRTYPALAFVMGVDQLVQFSTWYRFPEILSLSHWIVLERKPAGGEAGRRVLNDWEASGLIRSHSTDLWEIRSSSLSRSHFLMIAPTEAPDLSSTGIRESIAKTGTPPPSSLLPEVWGYLKENRLYGT